MNNKKNSIPLVILICTLFFIGITCLGKGIGNIVNKEYECIVISIGLGLITVAILLTRYFMRDES
jgi:hypothetical protein